MLWIDEVVLEEPVLDRSEWDVAGDCSLLGLHYLSRSYHRRQFRNRSILEDLIGSESKSGFACLSSSTNAENGITAKFEEVVINADLLNAEDLGPDVCERLFLPVAWRDQRRFILLYTLGLRERTTIDLAVGTQRQLVEERECLRNHVLGEFGLQVLLKLIGSERYLLRHDIADQTFAAALFAESVDHRRAHAFVLFECGFDLAEFDPVALDLDLRILSTEELEISVRQIAPEISSTIQALASARMGDETSVCFLFVAPVSLGQSDAADVKLAHRPHRTWLETLVQNLKTLIPHRPPVRNTLPTRINLLDRIEDGPDRRLGCAT